MDTQVSIGKGGGEKSTIQQFLWRIPKHQSNRRTV